MFARVFPRIYTSTCFHIYVSGYIDIPSSLTIITCTTLFISFTSSYLFVSKPYGVGLIFSEPIVLYTSLTPFTHVRLKSNTPFLVRSVNQLCISSPFALTVCLIVGVGFAFTSCRQLATTFFLTVPLPRK